MSLGSALYAARLERTMTMMTFTSYDFDYHNLHVVLFVNAFYVLIASRMLRYTALFRYIERALDLRLRRRLWDLLLRRQRLRSASTRRR